MLLTVTLLVLGQAAAPTLAGAPAQPNKVICRKVGRTGSRLPAKRQCALAADWALAERQAQGNLTELKARNQAGNPTSPL